MELQLSPMASSCRLLVSQLPDSVVVLGNGVEWILELALGQDETRLDLRKAGMEVKRKMGS